MDADAKILADQLLQENNFLRATINNLPHFIFWKNTQSVFLGCNVAFARSAELIDPAEIVGKTDFDLPWGITNATAYVQDDQNIMQSGIPKLNYEESQQIDGVEKIMLVSKVPIYNKENKIYGILGIYNDITEIKRVQKLAETANKAKTEFIANMSHDIRTPLTGIIGITALLEESAKTAEERENARMLWRSANKLLELLNNVLEVVSAEHTGEEEVSHERFDLRASMGSLYDLLLPSFTEKGLKLIIHLDPRLPHFMMNDRVKIERVLLNLMSNSIKFTEQGQITVQIHVIAEKDGQVQLEFKISDTGIGIAADQLHHIFDRFFRATSAYQNLHEGHGVGLYIVKKFVALLGGEIQVSSQLGEGSVFQFALWMKYDAKDQSELIIENSGRLKRSIETVPLQVEKLQLSTDSNKPRLLLVEDDPIATKVAKNFLQNAGFEVQAVQDGEAAFKLAKKENFVLILTDIGLPGMSGNEWTAAYRHWEWISDKPSVPIIGLTAHAAGKAKDDCLAAGMNDVFIKPINLRMAEDLVLLLTKENSPLPPEDTSAVPSLGFELPATEAELFQLDKYALFDEKDALEKLGGNPESLIEIITLFTEKDLLKEVTTLKQDHKKLNWSAIEQTAHKLKGSALYCGTHKMRYACQYVERYRLAGHSAAQEALFAQLIAVLVETRACLVNWLLVQKRKDGKICVSPSQ